MRFSIFALAAAAAVANAAGPVTQISDGQIQAPPSTYVAPSSTPVIATTPVVVPSSSVVVVVPSTPAVILTTAPVVVPSSASGSIIVSSVGSNSTLATLTPTVPAGASSTGTPAAPTGTGAADSLTVMGSLSFGAVALAGFLLA